MGYLNPAAGAAREASQAGAVDDIDDTSSADAEEVGDKVNELLGALRAAGVLATPVEDD